MSYLKRLWRRFLAHYRLSKSAVCEISHGGDATRALAETNKLEALKQAFTAGFEWGRDACIEELERTVDELKRMR